MGNIIEICVTDEEDSEIIGHPDPRIFLFWFAARLNLITNNEVYVQFFADKDISFITVGWKKIDWKILPGSIEIYGL